MANPFDQFDAESNGPTSAPAAENPFDQFDAPSSAAAAPHSTMYDVSASGAEGVLSGVNGLLGMPGDINSMIGDKWKSRIMGAVGIPPTISDAVNYAQSYLPTSAKIASAENAKFGEPYQPQTTAGQYARTVGSFVPGALTVPIEGPEAIVPNLLKYAVVPGVASEVAGQATQGSAVEPYARTVAGLVGGIAPDLAMYGGKQAIGALNSYREPMTAAGQTVGAARDLRALNPDIDAQLAQADQRRAFPGAAMGEQVPGSVPTLGQLTGNDKTLSVERELATKNPDLFHSNQFGTGYDQQIAARSKAINSFQPTGSPEEVGNFVRQQMTDIEAQHDAALQGATQKAQDAADNATNAMDATASAADAQHAAALTSATQTAKDAAAGIGTGATPEDLGANLRSTLQAARDATKTKERALWNAVDPDGTLALPADPVSSAASKISASMPATAKPMAGEESAIFDTAANLPAVTPFSDITALRSRVSSAMRQELIQNGQSSTYARLGQLRGSIEDAITNAATHKAAADASAVADGTLAPGDALGAQIDGLFNAGTGSAQSGENSARAVVGAPSRGSATAAGNSGAGSQGKGRSAINAGGQGIPGNVEGNPPTNQVLGPGKVYYPSGALDVNYEVANLPSLVTSHDTNFNVNPKYPAELQPRARETAPARDQVNSMASRLQPERLGPSPEANSGAPIVGPDNIVESGNGRTLAISKAYQSGKGGDYRHWLESQGIDTSGIAKPVLIARRTTPLTPENRVAFAHSANTASGLRMNAVEQAAADARLITPEALSSIADGSAINAEANRTFVRSFLSQLPASERGGMLDAGGNLSQAGVRRLEAAMASRAYGDGEFVSRAFDAADHNIRGIAGGLTDASGAWMKMRQLAREGVIDPEHDITPDVMKAARAVIRARAEGRPVSEILNQGDMFGGEASALAKNLILNEKGTVASREQITARLNKYANEAQKNVAEPGLFGDKVSPEQVLRTSLGDAAKPIADEPEIVSAAMKPGLSANLDEAASARLKKASAATRERAQTFDSGPIGTVLKKAGSSSDYKASDASVPSKLWVSGPKGAEAVAAYRKAAGANGAADMQPLHDVAAESFRREVAPEGIADPGKFASWRSRYQDALRTLPVDLRAKFSTAASASQAVDDLALSRKLSVDPMQKAADSLSRNVMKDGVIDPGKYATWKANNADAIAKLPADVQAKLSDAKSATEAMGEAAGNRKAAIDDHQKSIAGRFLGISSPEDVTKTVGGIFGTNTAVRDMSALAKKVASNADAQEGLRKAVADTIIKKASGTTEAGASGVNNLNASVFQKFIRDNAGAIKSAGFTDQEIGLMRAIGMDMQRSQRTMGATKLPNSPGTAQDLVKFIDRSHHPEFSLLEKVGASAIAGREVAGHIGAIGGASMALGKHLINARRDAGLTSQAALLSEAIRNPETALALLKKAPVKPDRGSEITLAKILARNSVFSASAMSGKQNRREAQ